MSNLYFVALLTGLVGSLHCIGMCGPIAIALPLGNKSWWQRVLGGITYNLGRIFTYALLGAVFGLLGQGIEMAGLQQWASIGIGAVMILSVLFPVLFRGKIKFEQFFFGYAGKMIGKFRQLFSISSIPSLFLIGLLNGLLPCGLVYVAIAGAINTNALVSGIVYMLLFGLGTIPVMLAIPLLGNLIGTGIRKRFRSVLSAFIVVLGILFILRGLSLGIPYISPPAKMLKPHEQMMNQDETQMRGGCCGDGKNTLEMKQENK
ncbi:MAG: sulfite exporter TauE/SafE family protein [Bacteroidales bacterium]|nr:sulfite exporter TauE/SafE family protein [Bacteroidales bacterium]